MRYLLFFYVALLLVATFYAGVSLQGIKSASEKRLEYMQEQLRIQKGTLHESEHLQNTK